MMPKVLIVDDEPVARERVARLLDKHLPSARLETAGDAVEAISLVATEDKPDLVFLDVQMPGGSGFDVIRTVGVDAMPPVVFVTAYDEYAVHAFDVRAVDYLLKPFEEDRFVEALERWRAGDGRNQSLKGLLEDVGSGKSRYLERMFVKIKDGYTVVEMADLDYMESNNNYVQLVTGGRSYLVRSTLRDFEKQLDPRHFARIHRSFVVNLNRIQFMKPWFSGDSIIILKTGQKLRLSRTYRDVLLRAFGGSWTEPESDGLQNHG
jgi:two-component system LytT family response regulator